MLVCGPAASTHAAATSDGGYPLNPATATYEAAAGKALDLTDEVTLEAWVKVDPMGEAGGRILDKSAPGRSATCSTPCRATRSASLT